MLPSKDLDGYRNHNYNTKYEDNVISVEILKRTILAILSEINRRSSYGSKDS